MIGAELTKLDQETLSLLTNRRVLAMLTPACRPRQICLDDTKALWKAANQETGAKYAALFNLGEEEAELSVELQAADMAEGIALTELWTGEKADISGGVLKCKLAPHASAVYGSM